MHSWNSQAEARSSSWNMVLARGRPTDTPSYFNGTAQHSSAQHPPPKYLIRLGLGSPREFRSPFPWGGGEEGTWCPDLSDLAIPKSV